MKPIYLRNVPPPAETFDHKTLFDFLCSWIKPECYLELGVRDGINFRKVANRTKEILLLS